VASEGLKILQQATLRGGIDFPRTVCLSIGRAFRTLWQAAGRRACWVTDGINMAPVRTSQARLDQLGLATLINPRITGVSWHEEWRLLLECICNWCAKLQSPDILYSSNNAPVVLHNRCIRKPVHCSPSVYCLPNCCTCQWFVSTKLNLLIVLKLNDYITQGVSGRGAFNCFNCLRVKLCNCNFHTRNEITDVDKATRQDNWSINGNAKHRQAILIISLWFF